MAAHVGISKLTNLVKAWLCWSTMARDILERVINVLRVRKEDIPSLPLKKFATRPQLLSYVYK